MPFSHSPIDKAIIMSQQFPGLGKWLDSEPRKRNSYAWISAPRVTPCPRDVKVSQGGTLALEVIFEFLLRRLWLMSLALLSGETNRNVFFLLLLFSFIMISWKQYSTSRRHNQNRKRISVSTIVCHIGRIRAKVPGKFWLTLWNDSPSRRREIDVGIGKIVLQNDAGTKRRDPSPITRENENIKREIPTLLSISLIRKIIPLPPTKDLIGWAVF